MMAIEGERRSEGGSAPEVREGRLMGLAVGVGAIAGLAAWGLSEATHRAFVPETTVVSTMAGPMEMPETASKRRTDTANAAMVYGGLGALLGLALGAVGGKSRGSSPAAARAAAVGFVVGAAAPAALAAAVVPRHLDYLSGLDPAEANLIMPLLFHGAVWLGVGFGGGLALGMGLGGRGRVGNGLIGGLIGAAIGAGAYEVIAALAVPSGNSAVPLSEDRRVRLVSCLAVALAVSALAAAAITSGKRPRPTEGTGAGAS